MTRIASASPLATDPVIGCLDNGVKGPLLICMAGIHGNEPAGVLALRRFFNSIDNSRPAMRGRMIGLAGNLPALANGVRFIESDLNRIWPVGAALIENGNGELNIESGTEHAERHRLAELVHGEMSKGYDPVYFIDFHTASATTAPFVLIADSLPNRSFAREFPVPLILGLEEQVGGTITDYVNSHGCITVGFEAGRHDDHASVDRCEAAIWVALAVTRMLKDRVDPRVRCGLQTLEQASARLPRILEIRQRYGVRPDDQFVMDPGYKNFQRVKRGQRLAEDRSGPICANEDGRILLPLYQEQGNDGFFLARRIRSVWLALSALLRRSYVDSMVSSLPGVQEHPDDRRVILVDPQVARWYTTELFHLLGFRKTKTQGGKWAFIKRPHDHTRA